MKELAPLLWIVAIALIFWLLIIRPASRQRKQMQELQASIAVGDEVMLTSGVFGTVTEVADDHLRVEIAPGVAIRVVRGAIGSIAQQPATGEPGGAEAADDEAGER